MNLNWKERKSSCSLSGSQQPSEGLGADGWNRKGQERYGYQFVISRKNKTNWYLIWNPRNTFPLGPEVDDVSLPRSCHQHQERVWGPTNGLGLDVESKVGSPRKNWRRTNISILSLPYSRINIRSPSSINLSLFPKGICYLYRFHLGKGERNVMTGE